MSATPDLVFRDPDQQPPEDASQPEPNSEVMEITPDLARRWLAIDVRMRKIRWGKVADFSRDMKSGKWTLNGETIKRTHDGAIIDGIHRLHAVLMSGAMIRSFVVNNLPESAQDTIDAGTVRTMGDQLVMRGVANGALVSQVTRWAWRWLRGIRYRGSGTENPTNAEMDLLLAKLPILHEAAEFAAEARKQFPLVRGPVWGIAFLVFSEDSEIAARVFLKRVADSTGLKRGDPEKTFRDRIIRDKSTGARSSEHIQFALLILAWNAWRENRTIDKLQLPQGGLRASNFPEPVKPRRD